MIVSPMFEGPLNLKLSSYLEEQKYRSKQFEINAQANTDKELKKSIQEALNDQAVNSYTVNYSLPSRNLLCIGNDYLFGKKGENILALPHNFDSSENSHLYVYVELIRVHINDVISNGLPRFTLNKLFGTYGADMPREIGEALKETKECCKDIVFPGHLSLEGKNSYDGKGNETILCSLSGDFNEEKGDFEKGNLDIFLKN